MDWQTAHKDHAIERVGVAFTFSEQIPSKPWTLLVEDAVKVRVLEGFTASAPPAPPVLGPGMKQAFLFAVGPGGISLSGNEGGRVLQRLVDNALHEEITLQRNQYTYVVTRYNRWDDFQARTNEIFGKYIDTAIGLVSLRSIKLEYWDRFVFVGTPDKTDYSTLLKRGTKHAPEFCFETSGLWHSHISPSLLRKRPRGG